MALDNDQYRELFIEEAKEHIDNLTKSMLILEKNPENKEVLNMLFRSAHTLKGSSGMMGFKDFQELTHSMEDVFDEMRKGRQSSSDLISALLECVDALSQRLENIQNKVNEEIKVEEFKNKLKATKNEKTGSDPKETTTKQVPATENNTMEFSEKEKEIIKQAEGCGEKLLVINSTFASDCGFKGIRAKMVQDKIAEIAKVVKTIPASEEFDEQKLSQGFKIAVTTKLDEKTIEKCAKEVLEVEQVDVISMCTPAVTPVQSAPIPNAHISPDSVLSENNYVVTIENQKIVKVLADTQAAQTVRVKFDQLDKLMNWVGELVINKIALLQVTVDTSNGSLKRITENIDRLTADLQDLVMQVRMVPVSQIFDRFPRLVRDLSLAKGKKINLTLQGKEIEVDRTVLDEIGEPLIHLLRNSVDHGIELPDERKKSSKNDTGNITLSAQRNGNQVIIEVQDDGAGIDPEKIKAAALKKGLVSQIELEKMNTEQLINLIFLPGLSTAKEITETSGRGVGMDVVKTKIAMLGGNVHIESQIGKGTKTTIKLPITLAIIQAILVKDATQTFAIPTNQVSEIVQVKRSEVKSLGKVDAVLVRDQVIPMVHLHQLLGLPDSNEEDLELLIIYFGDEHTKIGVVVDSVIHQQDILVKTLNENLSKIKGISGATILGDGQIILVLDAGQLVNRVLKKSNTAA